MKSSQGMSEQVNSLQNDLQLSEDRLKEAEEISWKSKAEASELVYALEQEQNSVKKLGAEVEVIQAKAMEDSLKHADALKAVQSTMSLEVEVSTVQHCTAYVSIYSLRILRISDTNRYIVLYQHVWALITLTHFQTMI